MKIHQLRNATIILTIADQRLLVDPMLAEPGSMPGFKLLGGGRRANPLVPLPPGSQPALDEVTGALITHEHPDHLDRVAIRWLRERELPVWASRVDAANLGRKGLDVRTAQDGGPGTSLEVSPVRHGRGIVGWLMGPVSSFFLAHPDEPSVYITSDAVLTEALLKTIEQLQPDVIIAPAGAANLGLGSDILFSVDELTTLIRQAPGTVVLNHLEALDHCPTSRADLRARLGAEGLSAKALVPEDGEKISINKPDASRVSRLELLDDPAPGLQKWLTSWFTGT